MDKVRPLIGMVGYKGAGKDSVAKVLVEEFDYTRQALADPLKYETYSAFGRAILRDLGLEDSFESWLTFVDAHKYDAPDSAYHWIRWAHQGWGTEYRRGQFGQDYWVNRAKPNMRPGVVFTDVRFPDEHEAIKNAGGTLWKIIKPDQTNEDNHASESHVLSLPHDLVITNDGTLVDLRRAVCVATGAAAEVPLGGGGSFIVDTADHDFASKYVWHLIGKGPKYVARHSGSTTVRIHRELMGSPKGQQVDHRNGDTLDNRRTNLRACTNGENARNAKRRRDNTSGYKGVTFKKEEGKFVAQIQVAGRRTALGRFTDPVEAARCYDEACIREYGDFARPNFSGAHS